MFWRSPHWLSAWDKAFLSGLFRLSKFESDEVEKVVYLLLSQGCIRLSTSPWDSPVYFASKKDRKLRLLRWSPSWKQENRLELLSHSPPWRSHWQDSRFLKSFIYLISGLRTSRSENSSTWYSQNCLCYPIWSFWISRHSLWSHEGSLYIPDSDELTPEALTLRFCLIFSSNTLNTFDKYWQFWERISWT